MKFCDRWKNGVYAFHKGYQFFIELDHPGCDWYIIAKDPAGQNAYDGWWRDSKGKSAGDAVKEALRGAMI